MNGKRILLFGVYSMELVECGGALLKNVCAGGESHAAILFASRVMQSQLKESAQLLQTSVEFMDFAAHTISVCPEQIKKLVYTIRKFVPNVIITQDPEHCDSDLDPGRRAAMTLILESIALASRDFALDEMPDVEPHPIATIYYHTPVRPNCLVDIPPPAWAQKVEAMDALKSQLEFSAKHYGRDNRH